MRPSVGYPGRPRPVTFLDRPNRYLARVRDRRTGRRVEAHVPNPGRMEELLVPGVTRGWMVPCADRSGRRTAYDLVAVRWGRAVVSIDSRVANRLVARALAVRALRSFGPGPWRSEVPWSDARWDFARLRDGRPAGLLEVKSSNLRVGTTALFPDAPTVRGVRHLTGLARAARRGLRAGLLVMVQRTDVRRFAPNEALDPEFARALRRAARAGVRIEARTMVVRPGRVAWGRRLPAALTFA